jgi:hypothetical protein
MSDTEPDENEEPDEKGRKKSSGTTLTLEEWFEELNKCDRLHQYAKKRKQEKSGEEKREENGKERREESSEKKRKEPKEGTTLSTEKWIETLNKHDDFDQYAKKRRKKSSERC